MDLTKPTYENISFIVEQIKEKLRMANVDAMKPESFKTEKYDELLFMYEMVMKRQHISSNEVEAIAAELGALRK
ncbi:DUF1128 domain-containing protein [Sporosarcina pasteurii]|uniref:Uncharacterized protein conserved in bacteria n=1 Tax=Sporosarcina pasteurii TaxID=1474 RepID=A0A380CB95_SPOPA|nr:DUF1128 domain-containing protein [Sporosarcina pasteurii]MDS9473343.1 DUF1128 domain-containing protein [Sporosarcina pasteurii]QBQ04275.1 DUF1128 domain-containing protein [Sporosarcina pasteurii]SUJ16914.1 Uncharacterized protein conserved in bacteria [Sporosarcina pasteurii]